MPKRKFSSAVSSSVPLGYLLTPLSLRILIYKLFISNVYFAVTMSTESNLDTISTQGTVAVIII